ncbi:MAG: hypothetical protein RI911_11 [Candidatus Parcubacteria bacterium]
MIDTQKPSSAPRAREMQWPDFGAGLAKALYSDAVLRLFGEEWGARVSRSRTGQPKLLPLEQVQLAIQKATNPEGSLKYKGDRGPLTRGLDTATLELLKDGKKLSRIGALLQIPGTAVIVDEALCNVLMVGCVAKRKEQDLPVEDREVRAEMEAALTNAITTVKKIASDPIFTSLGFTRTNWRSLFEQLVRAHMFESYQPVIITSVGGTSLEPGVAAGVNILPALKLAETLIESGYKPKVIGSFASEFAIACNDEDAAKTRANQEATQALYEACSQEFFPQLVEKGVLQFETPPATALQEKLPPEYIEFVREAMRNPDSISPELRVLRDSLVTTAETRTGRKVEIGSPEFDRAVDYLLSHQLIFRDIQTTELYPSVIKVGAPSEDRFSEFQRITTEAFMNAQERPRHLIPNATHHTVKDGKPSWSYGQITLFYPKIGERPPYLRETTTDEPSIFEIGDETSYDSWRMKLDSSVERYAALEKTLKLLTDDPDNKNRDRYIRVVGDVARRIKNNK